MVARLGASIAASLAMSTPTASSTSAIVGPLQEAPELLLIRRGHRIGRLLPRARERRAAAARQLGLRLQSQSRCRKIARSARLLVATFQKESVSASSTMVKAQLALRGRTARCHIVALVIFMTVQFACRRVIKLMSTPAEKRAREPMTHRCREPLICTLSPIHLGVDRFQ